MREHKIYEHPVLQIMNIGTYLMKYCRSLKMMTEYEGCKVILHKNDWVINLGKIIII
jgi:hypothetical protein